MIGILLSLLLTGAHAEEPTIPGRDGRLAGIPTATLASLGITHIEPSTEAPGWQAAVAGGWVRMAWHPDSASAHTAFLFQRIAASTRHLPDIAAAGADEAAGDPAGFLVVRRGNLIFTIRAAGAEILMRRLLAKVVRGPEPQPHDVYSRAP